MIVATKLHIPRIRHTLVSRPRLDTRLQAGLDYKLTLVTAPAGYGKTTLLSEWSQTLELPVAWISLDQGDNDRRRFWEHTIMALQQACTDFDAQAILQFAAADTSGDSFIAALINGLHRISQTTVLVWDDFHLIAEDSIMRNVAYLVERLPIHIHLYIASRTPPNIPLSKINAQSGLNRLNVHDLRFHAEETAEFFCKCGSMEISSRDVEELQLRTEGWVTGMRLAILSLDVDVDYYSILKKLSGTERDVADYFFEEVLFRQSDDMRQFLLRTSILERMHRTLCAEVTGHENSGVMLETLEQMDLFLVPLDDRGEWYRYHHLFQQFLQEQLKKDGPEQLHALHVAAGRSFEQVGEWDNAIRHYLASSSYEQAVHLIEKIPREQMRKEWQTLRFWLLAIPDEHLFARPRMYMLLIASLFIAGNGEEAETKLSWAKNRVNTVVDSFSETDRVEFQAWFALLGGLRAYFEKRFAESMQLFEEYVRVRPTGDLLTSLGSGDDVYDPLWDIYCFAGSPKLAEQVLSAYLQIWSETRDELFKANLYAAYGKLMYEWNRLDEAEHYFTKILDVYMNNPNKTSLTIASIWIARIHIARGCTDQAKMVITSLQEQINAQQFPYLMRKIAWFQALLGRKKGEVKKTKQWLRTNGLRWQDELPLSMVDEYELHACLLAEQERTTEAVTLIERLLHVSNKAGRQCDVIRLLIHKSMLHSRQGNMPLSMDILEQALALAHSEGYIRTFVDEGMLLAKLLDQYVSLRQNQHRRTKVKVPLPYVKRLLRLMPYSSTPDQQSLDEAYSIPYLTAKERSVLLLIETGITNKEIATKLGISISTVRTHINNIYSKLQVDDRLQALGRAKKIGIL